MPPFYPEQYQNQYPDQYNYGTPYDEHFDQRQYAAPPQSQHIPPFSQIQVNVPTRQYQNPPQSQPQFDYHQNFHPTYIPPQPPPQPQPQHQFQYQYQQQPMYPPQYQQPSPQQPHVQPQRFYQQPMPVYNQPPPQLQVNIPKPPIAPQISPQIPHQTQPQPQSQQRVLKDAQPAPRQQPAAPRNPPVAKQEPDLPEPEYDILLLSLADEYLETARKMSVRSEDHFRLTATALGCIDTVLGHFKLPPLREAQVGLKYAQVLFNETDNYDDVERILTKTIDLCERLKYHDLKYSAQLLLARTLHQSKPKAALKDLQGMIQDIEAYKHTAWEYAFRLQYVMFVLSANHASDTNVAIAQLERICHVARQSSDHAVFAFAAVLAALVHLLTNSADSVQSSQRSLAKARALQLNPEVGENPQICVMMELVDLCGHLKKCDTAQGDQKRKSMQKVVNDAIELSSWRPDGLMYLPLSQSSLHGLSIQEGGLIEDRHGKYYLTFLWLLKDEVEDLGYLLSGISASHKNAGDGGKAQKFLEDGLGMINDIIEEKKPVNSLGDVMFKRQYLVQCHFLLETALLQCSKGQWAEAREMIKSLDHVAQKLDDNYTADLKCLTEYVKGAIYQGCGEIDAALNIFQSPSLSIASQLDSHGSSKPTNQLHWRDETIRNICILAAMNTIFIIQQPNHPQSQRISGLVNAVDPLASQHPNKNIQAAWNFVLASLPNNTILKTKQYLGNALNAAQSINNAQITTLCLVTMQEKFFKGVVGDQAVKCARAASHQARRLNEPLWIATASGLEAECLGVHGMLDESAKRQEEMEKVMEVLPDRVKAYTTNVAPG